MQGLIAELKRRHVFRVGIAYAVIAWLLVQVAVSVEGPLRLPEWTDTLVIVILAIGFPVALLLAWAFEHTPEGIRREAPRAQAAGAQEARDGQAVSIAVLPFADMSPDKDQEYFADGISEELLNSLARIRDLRVSGRTSSFYFKGRNEDLRKVGEALGVRYILEGSVRKAGDRVRITAQLIDASTDAHLWSETYDRTFADLFEIQEEIAKAVASALQITLGVGGLGSVPGMTRNAAAYEEYLVAGVASGVEINLPTTPQAMRESIQHLERAVSLDPDFSLAWAGLHYVFTQSATILGAAGANLKEKGEHARERSLALTPDSPFVLSNMLLGSANRGDWEGARELNRQALAAADKYSVRDHFSYRAGLFRHMTGNLDEAIDHYERARLVDPLNANSAAYLCDAYAARGEIQLAYAEADRFRDYSGPRFVLVKASALMAAMVAGERAQIDEHLGQLIPSDANAGIALAMRERLDDPEAALAELERSLTLPEYQSAFQRNIIAIWAAYFGAPDVALELMREFLVQQNNRSLTFLAWRAIFRDVRRLPGFKGLLQEIGLVDYWRKTGDWGYFCRPVGHDDFECFR